MSKHVYQLLNNVETDFSEYETERPLSEFELAALKKKVLSSVKPKKSRKGLAAAACLALCLAGLGLGPLNLPVRAAAKQLVYHIQEFFGTKADLTPYTEILNQAVTENGVTLTLNEVILDGESLLVSYTREGSSTLITPLAYVNGTLQTGGYSGGVRTDNDGIMMAVMDIDLKNVDVSGNLDIELQFLDDAGDSSWNFTFSASGSELSAKTQEIPLGNSFSLPDGSTIRLTSFRTNDLSQKIYYEVENPVESYNLQLVGNDNLGNPILFTLSRSSETGGRLNLDTLTGLIGEDASSLTLTLYACQMPKESGREPNDYEPVGEPFTISLR
ncbi:MAG: DUF4179 domain-containing protein [Eubacteriales bacterium]|nr:DUF4179 domain-containing protein [Eubacteriales bacterium]